MKTNLEKHIEDYNKDKKALIEEVKKKAQNIESQYTIYEITAFVDSIFPFGEYYLHKREKLETRYKNGQPFQEKTYYYTTETNVAYCKKEDLINSFLILNRCNQKLANILPIPAREKKRLLEERENAFREIQNTITPQLKTIQGTDREVRAYQKAIYRGWITQTTNGYKWHKTKAQLAYFANKLYCPTNKEKMPYKAIEELFDVRRMDSAVNALFNNKKEQKWSEEIDVFLKEV